MCARIKFVCWSERRLLFKKSIESYPKPLLFFELFKKEQNQLKELKNKPDQNKKVEQIYDLVIV